MKKYFTVLLLALISSTVCAEIIDLPMSQLDPRTIKVEYFNDPTFSNVTCYLSHIGNRAWLKDSFPAHTSISCVLVSDTTQPVYIKPFKAREVYSIYKGNLDKTLRVNRYFDPYTNSLVYVAYTNQTGSGSIEHSISAVSLSK